MERTACAGSRWMTYELNITFSILKEDFVIALSMPRSRIKHSLSIVSDEKDLEVSDLLNLAIFFETTCQNPGHLQRYGELRTPER